MKLCGFEVGLDQPLFLIAGPCVIESRELAFDTAGRLQEICRQKNIEYIPAQTSMTGEDFGFFTTLYPGLLFWLGSGCSYPLHSDKFLPRDECLEIGVKIMSAFLTTE